MGRETAGPGEDPAMGNGFTWTHSRVADPRYLQHHLCPLKKLLWFSSVCPTEGGHGEGLPLTRAAGS